MFKLISNGMDSKPLKFRNIPTPDEAPKTSIVDHPTLQFMGKSFASTKHDLFHEKFSFN